MNTDSTHDREFVHSRLIDAPQDRVFRAFAQPEHLARWWGLDGFSSTFESFSLKGNGKWRLIMHGPDGTNYPNEIVFLEVEPPRRVVLEHLSEEHHFFLTISFDAQGDKSLVSWQQVFDTAEPKERVAAVVLQANEQNLDRLQIEVRLVHAMLAPATTERTR